MNEEFTVEKIVNMRKGSSRIEYLVKWQGYSDEENTWESSENLINTCYDLIDQYHKNYFFEAHKSSLVDIAQKKGNILSDKVFHIMKRDETNFIVSFYPIKSQFLSSLTMRKDEIPDSLFEQLNSLPKDSTSSSEYQGEKIGCVIDFQKEYSLVMLLEDKRQMKISSIILIEKYPEHLIDYLENLNWKKVE